MIHLLHVQRKHETVTNCILNILGATGCMIAAGTSGMLAEYRAFESSSGHWYRSGLSPV
jgi:hypothetical protein